MTDFRALCAELLSEIQALRRAVADEVGCSSPEASVMARARAALAQPEPQGPTDLLDETLLNEADAYFLYGEGKYTASLEEVVAFARRMFLAGQSWGRPAIEPVPVSERLPGPEDCDAEGQCWWWDEDDEDMWRLSEHRPWILCWTHWLPRWALPVPVVEDADG